MRNLSERFIGMAEWWARRRNIEPHAIIDGGVVEFRYDRPEDSDTYQWDDKAYNHGNVHLEGYAEAVVPEPPKDDDDRPTLTPSENFETALVANSLIPKMLTPGMMIEDLKKYVMAAAGTGTIAALVSIIILFQ